MRIFEHRKVDGFRGSWAARLPAYAIAHPDRFAPWFYAVLPDKKSWTVYGAKGAANVLENTICYESTQPRRKTNPDWLLQVPNL